MRDHVPPGDEVAAGQSGTLGFFRERVVNPDGKVNREALAYQANMGDYLRRRGVKWFVDWQHYAERYLGPDPAAHGWRLVATRADFRLYRHGADAPRAWWGAISPWSPPTRRARRDDHAAAPGRARLGLPGPRAAPAAGGRFSRAAEFALVPYPVPNATATLLLAALDPWLDPHSRAAW